MLLPNDTARVEVTVLRIQPVHKGRLLALASVELTIDGVAFAIHGLQVLALRHPASGEPATGIDLPRYRAADGRWHQTLALPEELRAPIGDAVLQFCCELGITRRQRTDERVGTSSKR